MDKADPEVITAALRDLRDRNYAAKTIRKYRDHLKAVFDAASSGTNKLVSRGYVLDLFGQGRGQEGDVPRVFRNQNDDDDHRKFFRPDERAKLAQFDDLTLQAANTKIATLLALNTGMRLGEVLALKWVDILDNSKVPNIDDPQWVEVRGSINPRREYSPTKSRKERRGKIINSKAMASALKAHRAIQNITRLQSQAPGWDLGFVCAAEDGLPPKPATLTSTFARRCEWAGITWERPARVIKGKRQWEKKTPKFHFTRSTFITVCIAELKIPQQLVMKWVGHATMSMNDHYFDQTQDDVLLDDETREAMDSLDEAAG
jgi:integrase